jgi:hypothetical protein
MLGTADPRMLYLGYERSLIVDPYEHCEEQVDPKGLYDRVKNVESFLMIRFGVLVGSFNWECSWIIRELLPLVLHNDPADRTIGLLDRKDRGAVGIFGHLIQPSCISLSVATMRASS